MQGADTQNVLKHQIPDGTDVRTTVIDFGDATIRRVTKNDLSILTVSGIYSRALGKELEKACFQCQTNLGIEFTEIRINPAFRKKFDSSIVGVLKNIRDLFRERNRQLLLCALPSELVDLLKLTGVYDGYRVVETLHGNVQGAQPLSAPAAPSKPQQAPTTHGGIVQKKIVELNQSLKRTATLEKGLDSAERCVKRFLPQSPPVAEGYEFAFRYKSSEKVGGDFFDFTPLSETTLGIVIGDVSGHGIDAAILMGITKKVFKLEGKAYANQGPRSVVLKANSDLLGDFNKYHFATVLYGILDLAAGTFCYVRAGHEMPILFGPAAAPTAISSKGAPIGIHPEHKFAPLIEEKSLQILPGGYLLLFTDGLSECWNTKGEPFGRPRLLYCLSQIKADVPSDAAIDQLLKSLADFAGPRPQEDDMTAILIRRLGQEVTCAGSR